MSKRLLVLFVVMAAAALGAIAFAFAGCGGNEANAELGEPGYEFQEPDVEVDLTAEVFQWEVYPGETVEAWGYNGQYPGPEIRVHEGERVRVNLTNNLPEPTTIHFHGLDVPNDQDGVPGITQPAVEPGETWTYEFVAERVGTTVYHTHANTAWQLSKGMFGFFIVEPKDGLDYDREYALGLHELRGLYTINGQSFPATLDSDALQIATGERILIRLANMGAQHHPMHLHGHQFTVVNIDGNPMPPDWKQNTVDIPPGQTVDLMVEGTNPGTWVFHCHIVPHVTNNGEYPGGMLTVLDYTDHTSYFEEQAAASEE
ncbi:MAG: copper oxidase [Dehalococcoidia bacterium]